VPGTSEYGLKKNKSNIAQVVIIEHEDRVSPTDKFKSSS
jgi:citrate lyase beta subunit